MCGISFREMTITMITVICWMTIGLAAQEEDLDPVKSSCLSQDSCQNGRDADAVRRHKTCECDESCLERDKCCLKSPSLLHNLQYRGQECIWNSITPTDFANLLVVTKCSPSWNGSSDVKELCEGYAFVKGNILMIVPVSNRASGHIYSNYFCAVCNHDHQDAVLWNVTFSTNERAAFLGLCEGDADQDLVYKTDIGQWGYWNHFSPGEAVFIPVQVTISATDDMYDWTIQKSCQSSYVWECADGWEDESVREKCNAYDSPVIEPWKHKEGIYQQRLFRNVHCAICNHVTRLDELICEGPPAGVGLRPATGYDGSGSAGETGSVTLFLGHQLLTKECREKNQQMHSSLDCRPVICRRKNC